MSCALAYLIIDEEYQISDFYNFLCFIYASHHVTSAVLSMKVLPIV